MTQLTGDVVLVVTVTTGKGRGGRGKCKFCGACGGSSDHQVLPEGAALGPDVRWHQAALLLQDFRSRAGSMIPGDPSTSPPQDWWWARGPPFSQASEGFHFSLGIPAPESGAWPRWCPSVSGQFGGHSLNPGSSPAPSGAAGAVAALKAPSRQVTTQKLRVIRRQRLRLRLLRATSAASWKTAWTFSWSRAEHSR